MPAQQDEISGEKIYCEGHRIEKPKQRVLSDNHHGFFTYIKHGKCYVVKEFRWKNTNKQSLIKEGENYLFKH